MSLDQRIEEFYRISRRETIYYTTWTELNCLVQ